MLLCTVAILTSKETKLEGINVLEIIFLQEVFFLISLEEVLDYSCEEDLLRGNF